MLAPLGGGGVWTPATLRVIRTAALNASKMIRAKLAAAAARPANNAVLEPVLVRSAPRSRQPIHPSAFIRQQKSRRWHSTTTTTYKNINAAIRRFMSTGRLDAAPRVDRSKFLNTQTGRAVAQITGRAPFASTLRPNLTGGALPRTAGGYGLGSGRVGGARYFSHTPAAQAQVVQNVSAAVRAFWISGQKAQFDGLTARGERKYRTVSTLQDETTRKMAAAKHNIPGSFIDFHLSPTVTALSPLAAAFPYPSAGFKFPALDSTTLNTDGFLDVLSVDFARALKDLTSTLADIKKLSSLGDLPIQLEKGHTLRVRFPGVDAETVESLCDDLGLTRGVVREDPDFAAETGVSMALKFPFAPGANSNGARTLTSPGRSLRSQGSFFPTEEELYEEGFSEIEDNPWMSLPDDLEGYESMSPPISSGEHCSEDFDNLEGIYRFLEECDHAHGRF
ncbi:putative casein kinase ii beta 2 subunit protein [Daldinia childiae]|uniref:putative casein kinase ii beta 2 subunit protein n=1 Tax=Daldinia childiae TaxID=326645 RepID=UPI001447175A|nr:putative casein kinase ii beta 2 subunit protein [Daldinia childiae]KAF3055966.1 putative casein kinase ii beta 2 subunit protein [Daldinia childiae]